MRIVVALGGNALIKRTDPPDAVVQEENVRAAVKAIAPLAARHELIITHGNGPQVGLLSLESAQDESLSRPYPFDTLGAETQGLIGYWLVQALGNQLRGRTVAGLLTQTLVSGADPAFRNPTKFVGPVYGEDEANRYARERGWDVRPDGAFWRRVMPSPAPLKIVELGLIRHLVKSGTVVVCAGGGGIPVLRNRLGDLRGVEAVVDKDRVACLLAEDLEADFLLLLTDVDAVVDKFGQVDAWPIRSATPSDLRSRSFPDGSMGPKVESACRFVEVTGGVAGIGALCDAESIVSGTAGTRISASGDTRDRPFLRPRTLTSANLLD